MRLREFASPLTSIHSAEPRLLALADGSATFSAALAILESVSIAGDAGSTPKPLRGEDVEVDMAHRDRGFYEGTDREWGSYRFEVSAAGERLLYVIAIVNDLHNDVMTGSDVLTIVDVTPVRGGTGREFATTRTNSGAYGIGVRVGPSAVRAILTTMLKLVRADFPQVRTIAGERVTGARWKNRRENVGRRAVMSLPADMDAGSLNEADALTEAPATEAMRATRYYHGTSNETFAEGILRDGIKPDQLHSGQSTKTTRGMMDPVAGRAYVTPSLHYGIIYAIGGNILGTNCYDKFPMKNGPYGFLFIVNGSELVGDIQPDEDSVGEFIENHTKGGKMVWDGRSGQRTPYAFDPDGVDDFAKERVWRNIRAGMTPKQFQDAAEGEVASQASGGKRALKKLPVQDMLDLIRWGAHVAHQGGIKPAECWRIDKLRTKELAKDGSNFFEIAERIA